MKGCDTMSMRGGGGAGVRAKPPRLASHHGLYNQVIVEPAAGCCNDTCNSCAPTLCVPSDKGPLFSGACMCMGGRGVAAVAGVDVAWPQVLNLPVLTGIRSHTPCHASLRCACAVVHVTEALPDELDRIVRYPCGRASLAANAHNTPARVMRGSV